MGGKVSKLVLVAKNNPDLYRTFLSNLRAGCSLASSSASIGISPKSGSLILGKIRKGIATREEKKIGRDIRTALGRVLGLTEAELRKLDPKYWLTHGPGRLITNEWNDTQSIMDNNRAAQNSISSKDVTDALIQLYKCGISIDQLIESGQITTLNSGAAPNSSSNQLVPRLDQTIGDGHSAGVGYGESSYGLKETNRSKESGHRAAESSWGQKETNGTKETSGRSTESSYGSKETNESKVSNDSPTSTFHNPTSNPSNHLPVNRNNKSYNYTNTPPPKLLVDNKPIEIVDSIDDYVAPGLEPVVKKKGKIVRTPKVLGKREPFPPPGLQEHLDRVAEQDDGDPTDWSDTMGASEDSSKVSEDDLDESDVYSQESLGTSETGERGPVSNRKSKRPIEFTHDRNYDGPKIEKVSIMKVDPKSVPVVVPECPEKKGVNNLPPTNADIARKQHQQKNEEMEEGLVVLETLPDGLREFLSRKGIV